MASITHFFSVHGCTINGTKYSRASVVICGVEIKIPNFGKIKELLMTDLLECFFIISPLITSSLSCF